MTAAEISRALADRVLDLAMDLLPGGNGALRRSPVGEERP